MTFARKGKFNARRTVVDNITFDSKKEALRYMDLKILAKTGHISKLELQPEYPMIVNGHKVCSYRADFRYVENGKTVIEDVKGYKKNPLYSLKKKLLFACYNIKVCET